LTPIAPASPEVAALKWRAVLTSKTISHIGGEAGGCGAQVACGLDVEEMESSFMIVLIFKTGFRRVREADEGIKPGA